MKFLQVTNAACHSVSDGKLEQHEGQKAGYGAVSYPKVFLVIALKHA